MDEDPPRAGPITVFLVDDHAVVRGALRALLDARDGIEVCGEASDLSTLRGQLADASPRVLVLDVNLPDGLAVDALAELREQSPGTAFVLLTMEREVGLARRALAAGALGYLLKDAAQAELIEAVQAAAAGRRFVSPAVAAGLEGEPARGDSLSPREREVLRLVALGHTNREVAEQLALSVRTVETHRAHIQQKLHLATRPELTRYALDHRLIDG